MHTTRVFTRCFHTSPSNMKKVQLHNSKGKSMSSQQWLKRQISDPYVEKAKQMNYRCRSAFKLLEIDERFAFLKQGQLVIDCGAAPGSWTQVVVKKINADGSRKNQRIGMVIAVDLQHIHPIPGAITLGGSDFTQEDTHDKIAGILKSSKVDVVLSDMAPNATGVHDLDNENILKLCYTVLRYACIVSAVEASLVVKMWQCPDCKTLENDMLKFYDSVHTIKPQSSRSDSSEIFLFARCFKGLKERDDFKN